MSAQSLVRCLPLALLAALGAPAGPALAQPAPAATAAEAPRFAVVEYEIVGNTVLPVAAVEQAVLPFMGEGRTLADVERAREALEKAYQQAGFLTVLVDIPEQRVDAGLVQLRVIEGRVERLAVTGSRYYDQGVIRERVAQFAPGEVPNFNEAQRQLATLSREERQVQPVLRPGQLPGTVEIELKVADRLPLGGSVELNNRHGAGTESWRVTASARYDNLFQRDHGLALSAITAPADPKQSRVLTLNYTVPLAPARSLLVYGLWSDSRQEPLGAATVVGRGHTLGLRWLDNHYAADAVHSFSAGFDFKSTQERVQAGSDEVFTPLRYLPLQLQYNGSWFGPRSRASLSTSLTAAWRGLLARDVACPGTSVPIDQFACKRQGSDGSFALWRGDWRLGQPLGDWPGSFNLRLGWQIASQPLPSAEQYAIGGADSVRGYYEAEGSGDHALLGSLEWRSNNLAARVAGAGATWLDEATLLGFAELARAYVSEPLAGQAARVSLAGAGIGLRLRAWQRLQADLDLAWPLKRTAASPQREPRLHVRLLASF